VIRITAVPSSRRNFAITSRICAWMVTSSAEVGSSAISTSGLHATAIAIIARCRIPPESWCGYSFARCSGSGMPTRPSIWIVRASACARVMSWCRISASLIWRPIVITGFSDVIGSWKIIAIRLPRICAHRGFVELTRILAP
jgi:hypothetical protein